MVSTLVILSPREIGAVAAAWEEAEAAVRAEIGENFPGTGEEFITERFHGKFAETLRQTPSAWMKQAMAVSSLNLCPSRAYSTGLRTRRALPVRRLITIHTPRSADSRDPLSLRGVV